jgi:hypothetical protein
VRIPCIPLASAAAFQEAEKQNYPSLWELVAVSLFKSCKNKDAIGKL